MAASKIKAGEAFVTLGLQDTAFVRGLRNAESSLRKLGTNVQTIGRNIAAAGAAVLGAGLFDAKVFADVGSALVDMAARTGISVEALSELGFAAEQTGADLGAVEVGARKMQKTIVAAASGSKEAAEAINELGLTVAQLVNLSPQGQFEAVAETINRIEDPTRRAAAALAVFGKSGTALLPMIEDMDRLRRQARDLGLVMSSQTAAQADALGDTLHALWRVVKNVAVTIGAALAPTIGAVATSITRLAVNAAAWIRANREIVDTGFRIIAAIVPVGAALFTLGIAMSAAAVASKGLAVAIGLFAGTFKIAAGALALLSGTAGIAVVAVAALGVAIVTYTTAGRKALMALGEAFAAFGLFVADTVGGVADALVAGDIQAAAAVLWTSLRLAWETGVAPLKKIWIGFTTAMQEAGVLAFAGLKSAWVEIRDWFERNFPEFTAGLAKTWANVWAGMARTATNFHHTMTDLWLNLMSLFDDSFDVDAAKALNQADLDSALDKVNEERRASIAEADRRKARSDKDRESEKAAALAGIEEQKNAALVAAEAEHDQRMKDAQAERDAAGKAFDEAVAKAGAARAGLPRAPQLTGADAIGIDELADRAAGAASGKGASAVGAFGGADIGRLVNAGVGKTRTESLLESVDKTLKQLRQDALNNVGLEY